MKTEGLYFEKTLDRCNMQKLTGSYTGAQMLSSRVNVTRQSPLLCNYAQHLRKCQSKCSNRCYLDKLILGIQSLSHPVSDRYSQGAGPVVGVQPKTYYMCIMNVNSSRSLWIDWDFNNSFLLPFKVLQRFGRVRSSMDFTDWNIIVVTVYFFLK